MKKNICFLIGHPFDLVLFLGLKNILNEKLEIYTIALFTDHQYFKKCSECESFLNEFDELIRVATPTYGKNIFKNLIKSFELSGILKNIISKYNPIFFSANRSELITKLIEKYSENNLYRILQRSTVDDERIKADYGLNLKHTVLRRLYEIALGLEKTSAYVNNKTKNIWYFKHFNEDVSRTFYLINKNEIPKPDEIHFPYYFTHSQSNTSQRKIYFFGSRFLGWDFLHDDSAIKTINSILRKIEEVHNTALLIYKPHPLESNESEKLDLGKFIVDASPNSSEIEYTKYFSDIEAVYSIGSTSSKTAFNFGLKSYLTYKLFKFDKSIEEQFNNLFLNLPENMFIDNYDDINTLHSLNVTNFMNINNLSEKLI